MPSSKSRKTASSGSLLTERNRIRGLIGASKSRRVELDVKDKKDKLLRTRMFQRALSAALLQAREKISTSQFDAFLAWLEGQTTSLLSEYGSYATNSELMSEVMSAHPLPLHKEILWIVSRLLQHQDLISDFLKRVTELEKLIWHGTWQEIESHLNQIERKFGKSIWILEARITLEQDFRGLEAQKNVSKTERQISIRGLTTFTSHHISVRNEPTTVLNRFASDFEEKIKKETAEPLQNFLRYRILGQIPEGTRPLGHVLKIAQGLAEVDLYESLIFVAQQLVAHGPDSTTKDALINGFTKLQDIHDPRIDKILLLLGAYRTNRFTKRDLSPADSAVNNPGLVVLKNALKTLKENPGDFKAAMLAASQLTGRARLREETQGLKWHRENLVGLMGNVLSYASTYESDLDALEKYFLNHSFLPHLKACRASFVADMRCTATKDSPLRRLAALNNPYLDPDDLSQLKGSVIASYQDELSSTYSNSTTLSWNIAGQKQALPDSRCRPFSADVCIEIEGGLSDFNMLSPKPQAQSSRWKTVFAGLTDLHAEIYQNKTVAVVRKITDLYLQNEVPLAVIPVQIAIGHLKWKQLKQNCDELSLPIALHLYWRATNSEEAATNVRFSYDFFLESQFVKSATSLLNQIEKFDRQQLIYFLKNICVPSVMDMNKHIGTSKAAEEERRKICSMLCEVDPENRTTYQAEIVGLVHAESLAEGIKVVDSSRVHVDTNAIKAWAKRQWVPNFERYKSLVKAGVGLAAKIDVVLREASRNSSGPGIFLQTPESEADQVLIELMLAMRSKFLLDPQHGLDSYLSRRVRHHSMGGYLRGPLEEAKLITFKRAQTKRYLENTYWLERIPAVTPQEREKLRRAFEQFAEEIDRTIGVLKSDLFRVHSEEYPRGLFDIVITPASVHLARSFIQADLTLDDFCSICFSLFWGALDPSLQMARRQLHVETKDILSGSFHRLRASLKKTLSDPARYAELSAAMGNASEKVLRETDRMADWFMRREIQSSPRIYSLNKVFEIAIRSALESHRPFDPEVKVDIASDCEVKASDLVVIAEIMLTTIGNAKQYSVGIRQPMLNIIVSCNSDEKLLFLRIENKVGLRFLEAEALLRIESIRRQIDDGSYVEKVRKEGESGLMKIASTISQSVDGRLNFGFTDAKLFFTDVTLSFNSD